MESPTLAADWSAAGVTVAIFLMAKLGAGAPSEPSRSGG